MIHGNILNYNVPYSTILLRQTPHKVFLRQEHNPPYCLAGKAILPQRLRGYEYFQHIGRGVLRAGKPDGGEGEALAV